MEEFQNTPLPANSNYALFQIARAITTANADGDEATRSRARERAAKWTRIWEGMMKNQLNIGSRQPIAAVPVWATLDVMTGGFTTGGLLAGGPLQTHEKLLAERIGISVDEACRGRLNQWYVSESGLAELSALLKSGCYEIQFPEEGALLAVAWLLENQQMEAACGILDAVASHFATLRFFPRPASRPASVGARIYLENVGNVSARLRQLKPNRNVLMERESIQVWTPLYDEMVGLFLETVEGQLPCIVPDADGRWVSPETGKFNVVGGWPCQQFPESWLVRASTTIAAIENARLSHQLCTKPNRNGDSFASLFGFLSQCIKNSATLSGRDVGMIRLIVARHITKKGTASSQKFAERQARQTLQVAAPLHSQAADVVRQRLERLPSEDGLPDLESVLQPITAKEVDGESNLVGSSVPPSIARKVSRCLWDTAETLIGRGIITSGDTLAAVIPQYTAGLAAESFDDVTLRSLYASIYRSFRRRRSLLLLNLEKQIRIEELPWLAAINQHRKKDVASHEAARLTLKEIAGLTLKAFPYAIFPNKLLQEFTALANAGSLGLSFTEELAADIFINRFSPKFIQAAKQAATYLEGSLYARYYDFDCEAIRRLPETEKADGSLTRFFEKLFMDPFVKICEGRAFSDSGSLWGVVRNGMIIEQALILTTHNLALLFESCDLRGHLKADLNDMAKRCFLWICRRQQAKSDHRHAKLIMLKQTAYAWRQMIFFLSQVSPSESAEFMTWAEQTLHSQSLEFQLRFMPVFRGLTLAHQGYQVPDTADARRFVGWAQGHHWLLGNPTDHEL